MINNVHPYALGLGTSFSLISTIGLQNAYALKKGILRSHRLLIIITLSLCDAILITVGIVGVSQTISANPKLLYLFNIIGIGFFFAFGLYSIYKACAATNTLDANPRGDETALKTFALCLVFTFLNPLAYTDTILVIGLASTPFQGSMKFLFACGAYSGSVLWFTTIVCGASYLQQVFKNPKSWRILDFFTAFVMFSLCYTTYIQC